MTLTVWRVHLWVFPSLDLEVTLCSLCHINTLSVCPVTRDVSFDQLLKIVFCDLTRCGVFVFFWASLLPKPLGGQLVQFSSVAQSCPTLCDPMNRSTPGLPVHHQLPEFTQTHVYRVGDAIQPSHPLSSPSPPAPSPSQHQSLFQWVSSSHEMAKVLEFQL